MNDYPYQVFSHVGHCVLQATASCRYSKQIELDLLEAGYTIRLHGKKLTKTELRKEKPAR